MEASCQCNTKQPWENAKYSPTICELNTSPSVARFCETHNSNWEVIVDNLIRHWITLLLNLIWYNLHTPAVHWNHKAALNVFKNATQIFTVISCKNRGRMKQTAQSYIMCTNVTPFLKYEPALTSTPTQTARKVISCAQRKHGNRRPHHQTGFIWFEEVDKRAAQRKYVKKSLYICFFFSPFCKDWHTYRI